VEKFKKRRELLHAKPTPVFINQHSITETAKNVYQQQNAYQSSKIDTKKANVTQNELLPELRVDAQTQVPTLPVLPSLPPQPAALYGRVTSPQVVGSVPIPAYVAPITRPDVVPQLYHSLHQEQRQVLSLVGRALVLTVAVFALVKLAAFAAPSVHLAQIFAAASPELAGMASPSSGQEQGMDSRVLAANTTQDDIVLKVYVPSEFWSKVTVNNDLVVSGSAAFNGGEITSTAPILNIAEAGTGTINLGGGATAINLGSATGQVTIRGKTLQISGVKYTFPSVQGGGGTYLKDNGSGLLTWTTPHQVSNFSELTGLVPLSQGGTNNSAGYPAGAVIYSDGSMLTSDNAHFFYDASNYRLGIGLTSPAYNLDVNGTAHI